MKTTNTLKLSTYTCQLVLVVTDQVDAEVNALYKKNKLADVFDLNAEGVMVKSRKLKTVWSHLNNNLPKCSRSPK